MVWTWCACDSGQSRRSQRAWTESLSPCPVREVPVVAPLPPKSPYYPTRLSTSYLPTGMGVVLVPHQRSFRHPHARSRTRGGGPAGSGKPFRSCSGASSGTSEKRRRTTPTRPQRTRRRPGRAVGATGTRLTGRGTGRSTGVEVGARSDTPCVGPDTTSPPPSGPESEQGKPLDDGLPSDRGDNCGRHRGVTGSYSRGREGTGCPGWSRPGTRGRTTWDAQGRGRVCGVRE